ncbi:S16 family serine protease [Kitasatospora aburaviensis]
MAAFVPLPYTLTWPGVTADTLGSYQDKPVLTITGAPVRTPRASCGWSPSRRPTRGEDHLLALAAGLVRPGRGDPADRDRLPAGDPAKAEEVTAQQMVESQDSATAAALSYLHLSPDQVKVKVDLGDIGGPSAGQMLALGIVDKLAGDGKGGDLTGGLKVAGTGTIDDQGAVGAVGGVPLKTQAAARDGATVFLLPKDECADAKVNTPAGLRLVPVGTLGEAVSALDALRTGGAVPSC